LGLLGTALRKHLDEIESLPIAELVARRRQKFRNMAQFYTES
jgi:acetyl-CoA carboxylase carboxyl transferase subunit alpha